MLTLSGNVDVDVELISPVPDQVGVPEELSADQNGVDGAVAQVALSLLSGGDVANSANKGGCSCDSLLHGGGIRHLVPRTARNLLSVVEAAARDVEEVDALV